MRASGGDGDGGDGDSEGGGGGDADAESDDAGSCVERWGKRLRSERLANVG